MTEIELIKRLLSLCTAEQRREIFHYLRKEFPTHPLEEKWNVSAEVILEAIERSSDLTQRGIRGVIAEASFEIAVVKKGAEWRDVTPNRDLPYDFLLEDGLGRVRVQVKMQRLKDHKPMKADQGYRFLPSDHWVVETQRTRAGKKVGEDTRPYRFGEFDILAVSMHPSSNDWNNFMYTVADWLLPRQDNPTLILKFQPVAMFENHVWTNSFEKSVEWLRSGEKRKLS